MRAACTAGPAPSRSGSQAPFGGSRHPPQLGGDSLHVCRRRHRAAIEHRDLKCGPVRSVLVHESAAHGLHDEVDVPGRPAGV